MEECSNEFFYHLLAETKGQFEKSQVFRKQTMLGRKWNYSICATPIQKEKGVIFGINWGAPREFEPQTAMPTGEKILPNRFLQQSKLLLENNLGLKIQSVNFNYTNLCFFRSPKADDLTRADFELSLPLFEKYIRFINPPWLLSIGGTNLKVLNRFGALSNIRRHFDNQNKFKGHSGKLWEYDIFSVPHPSARLTKESRQTIWTSVTQEMKKATYR